VLEAYPLQRKIYYVPVCPKSALVKVAQFNVAAGIKKRRVVDSDVHLHFVYVLIIATNGKMVGS
jgi:hypothetical protein